MLFWILGILNMTILLLVGGSVSAVVGGCYTVIIYMVARHVAKTGCIPFSNLFNKSEQ